MRTDNELTLDLLPPEVWSLILEFLSLEEQIVSSSAYDFFNQNIFWSHYCKRYLGQDCADNVGRKELSTGISDERRLFIKYYCLLMSNIMKAEHQMKKSKQEYLPRDSDPLQKRMNDTLKGYLSKNESYLDHALENSDDGKKLKQQAEILYRLLLKHKLNQSTVVENFHNFRSMTPFKLAVEILCQIDAPISMRFLFEVEKTFPDELLLSVFKYPSPRVLKVILDNVPDIANKLFRIKTFNEGKQEVYEEGKQESLLMSAILGLETYHQIEKTDEVVTTLLAHDAETDFTYHSNHCTVSGWDGALLISDHTFDDLCRTVRFSLNAFGGYNFNTEQQFKINALFQKIKDHQPLSVPSPRL